MADRARRAPRLARPGSPAPDLPVGPGSVPSGAAAPASVLEAASAPARAPARLSPPSQETYDALAPGTAPTSSSLPSPAPVLASAPAQACASTPSFATAGGAAPRASPPCRRPTAAAPAPAQGISSAAVATSHATALRATALPAVSAETGAQETALVVQRFYGKSGSNVLRGGDSVHAYFASDLYLKHISAPSWLTAKGMKSARVPPCKLIDFKGCQEPVLLRRLSDEKTLEDVDTAVSWKFYSAPKPGAESQMCPGLRIRGEVRDLRWPGEREADASAASASDIVLLFEPECEDHCRQWVDILRSRIKPLALRRHEVNAIARACSSSTTALLNELETIYKQEDADQERMRGDGEGADANTSAACLVERSETYMRRLERVSLTIDHLKAAGEGSANLKSGSDVADTVARVLGGVTLIGPIVSVANVCICIAKLVAQAREDKHALGNLCERVPRIAHRLSRTLFIVLRASGDSLPHEILQNTFNAVEECWKTFNEAERYLLMKNRHQFCLLEHAKKMKDAVEKLELSMKFALRDEIIAANSLGLREVRNTIANLGHQDVQLKRAVFARPKPSHVVREAIPDYEALRDSLLSGGTTSLSDADRAREQAASGLHGVDTIIDGPQLVGDTLDASVSAVDGDGGYGKTTCLLLLANDRLIQDAFSFVLFIQLGPSALDSAIVSELAHFAKVIGPGPLAECIEGVPAGPNQVLQAVNHLRPRLANARTLLILDNVWQRQAERQWVAELSALVSGGTGSSVLVSTRSGDLAACADKGRRFTVGRVTDESAARRIIEMHAGLEPGASKPQGSDGCHVSEGDEAEYGDVMALMLRRCDGWHLALGMCGALAKLMRYRWASIGQNLRDKLVEMPSKFATRDVRHPGLQAIMETNLDAAQEMLSELAFTLEFCSDGDRQAFESVKLRSLFSRLSICDATRELPYYCLGPLFGMTQSCGEAIGALFEKAGLAKTRGNVSQRVLWVHDLQYASAELLCKAAGGHGALATVHRTFLQSCAEHFSTDAESVGLGGCTFWPRVCERADAGGSGESLATYVCNNLVRHLVESSRDGSGALRIEWRRDDLGSWNVESECLKLLCSYEWVRARGHKFGRTAVVRDFVVLVDAVDPDRGNFNKPARKLRAGADQVLRAAWRGTHYALQTCLKVLLRVGLERFNQDKRGDSGLAGELYGRLAVNEFKRVDEAARPYALHVAAMLQTSIRESARPPWLCPRNECYMSSESSEDERCVSEFATARGRVFPAVEYVQVGEESLLLCGGGDGGSLWAHDARDPGGVARELTGHDDAVISVVAAGRGKGDAAGNVLAASCSGDGTVRLWVCENGATKGEVRSLQTLETSNRRALFCVDLTPDAARVVAGGSSGVCCVHVWTRRSAGAAAAAGRGASGADAYAAISLSGHTERVRAVRVSRTGERVVSVSRDGTVRVWRVAMDAADRPSHRLVSWADDDRGKPRSPHALALAADAQTVYVADSGRSDIALVDCDSAREVAALRSDSVGSHVFSLALLESCGGGASGRLFAGHENGVISEWDLAAWTCSAVYGDPLSRAGGVACITARFLDQANAVGDAVARSESTRAGPRVTGAAVGTGGGRDGDGVLCAAGQSRVEFAAGHTGGAVRVWRARSGYGFGENSAAEAGAGVGEPAVERHADTPDDLPFSFAASGDGRWLVSGSRAGVLCVWDTGSGACVATLRGHKDYINGIDVSGDGAVFVSCSDDGIARVWTLQSSREWSATASLDHEGVSVACVVMTADALQTITGDVEGHVRVWNTRTGMLCVCGRDKHSNSISSVAAFQGGAARSGANLVFASRDGDGTCVLWSLSSGGDLACEEDVSVVPEETGLGTVFTSCAEAAPVPACWHEQRGYMSLANHFVFSGGGRGGTHRYELSGKYRAGLRVVESENESRASVALDSSIICYTCFQRQEDGDKHLVVCCGLENGMVAMFDLILRTS